MWQKNDEHRALYDCGDPCHDRHSRLLWRKTILPCRGDMSGKHWRPIEQLTSCGSLLDAVSCCSWCRLIRCLYTISATFTALYCPAANVKHLRKLVEFRLLNAYALGRCVPPIFSRYRRNGCRTFLPGHISPDIFLSRNWKPMTFSLPPPSFHRC